MSILNPLQVFDIPDSVGSVYSAWLGTLTAIYFDVFVLIDV